MPRVSQANFISWTRFYTYVYEVFLIQRDITSHLPQILESLDSWQLFARNLLLANTDTLMLLCPEHDLVFVIKCLTLMRCLP